MISKNIQPIILCGGSGTRLWPLSRDTFPKQYISLSSKNKQSLLQNTIKRLKIQKQLINIGEKLTGQKFQTTIQKLIKYY